MCYHNERNGLGNALRAACAKRTMVAESARAVDIESKTDHRRLTKHSSTSWLGQTSFRRQQECWLPPLRQVRTLAEAVPSQAAPWHSAVRCHCWLRYSHRRLHHISRYCNQYVSIDAGSATAVGAFNTLFITMTNMLSSVLTRLSPSRPPTPHTLLFQLICDQRCRQHLSGFHTVSLVSLISAKCKDTDPYEA